MYRADNQRVYVATYQEILLIFISFAVILFVLYPKELLQEQILKETSNYDLSMLYLKNMLKQDPSNESLMIFLAEQSLSSGKRDLAYRLSRLLLGSQDTEIKKKAYLVSYNIAKADYYYVKSQEQRKKILKDLDDAFSVIVKNEYYNQDDLYRWYEEAEFLHKDQEKYELLKKVLMQNPNDVALLTTAYYLANKLEKPKDVLKFLFQLQEKDRKNRQKWLFTEYHFFMKREEYVQAEAFLKKNSDDSDAWKELLANFYTWTKKYKKASNVYIQLYKTSEDEDTQILYFTKAIQILQSGNYLDEAANLGHKYEKHFFTNIKVRNFLLKLYIATNHLDKARALSNRILKSEVK